MINEKNSPGFKANTHMFVDTTIVANLHNLTGMLRIDLDIIYLRDCSENSIGGVESFEFSSAKNRHSPLRIVKIWTYKDW